MAVAAYSRWDSLGRPIEPAQPIREIVERLKAAFPKAASTFSWYANEAHYQAEPPQDHTPFSQTGWPLPSPQWWVFATDVMHRPDLGVDCDVLFAYWIAEARAGRMPWLKYLIWQATIYDVRNGWKPQPNAGHFDHVHLSARTDFKDIGLGSWSLLPGGDDDMALDDPNFYALIWRVEAEINDRPFVLDGPRKGERNEAHFARKAIEAKLDGLLTAVGAIGTANPDVAAILAGVDQRLAALRSQVEADTRDAVADGLEGGAAQVRADQ